ncbi:4-hydroxy-tetrahydrodipicolinate synthase [Thiomicrospira sp. S5]|uniref:4-hydroxy-tetrahydrodipicolinate synthase n=2 Tax=Piscirickettsiaceae TaxID=135616 RepID=A0A410H431_9GAMM|nr:4-hydroxy-tetrahydrodipicolinate synthase [Hydrogenovibrio thermophilus]AZR83176.1 4-hydroxy-tetrahydrodipicolinate synthase [Thiomicrospira sp. S5]QAB15679.1 4-hydroxy-tetrahydrodipicolinate synthase [Hydrogenovibrio thermophilus]
MFRGSMVALVTPMKADESVDFDALEKLIEFHIKSKTKAIVAMGTTGESATLDFEEHREVVRFVVDKTAGRIPVIAGTGANSTTEAIELTEYAKDVGADACLLVTPYYNKPTQEGLYLHYKKIAETVDIPQILYNVPGRTACDLLPETIGRLASIQNIVGVKEATGDVGRVAQIKALVGDDFDLYTGDDGTAVDFLLAGGHGGISVTANVAPQRVSEVYDAAVAGDAEKARELDAPLTELHKALFVEANPIPVKWAMMEMGLMGGAIRLPLTPLSEKYHEVVRQALRTAGAL